MSKTDPLTSICSEGGSTSSPPSASFEERFSRLEAMVQEIHDFIYNGEPQGKDADGAFFRRAIRDLKNGNRATLELYLRRGGKIPRG